MSDIASQATTPDPRPQDHVAAQPQRAEDSSSKLRVGVMLDGWTDRAWVAKVIGDVQESGVAEVVAVVLNRSLPPSRWQRITARLPHLLFTLYHTLDRWLFRRLYKVKQDAFEAVDLRPLLSGADVLEVVPQQKRFTDRFEPQDIAWVRQRQLDVILRFGFRIIRGGILDTARYGVWSFHHGDNREYRGVPPMFWEMYEGNPVCGVTLQILTDQLDGGKVIYRTSEQTNFLSLYMNRNRCYWKATSGVPMRLRQLRAQGGTALTELDSYQEQVPYTKGVYRQPGNLVMLKFLCQRAGELLRRAFNRLATEEQWFVAWRRRPEPLEPGRTDQGESFRLLTPPRGIFYADPFIVQHEGRHCIFFEDYEYASGLGAISWIEIDADGNPSEPKLAFATDCHLSYPCLLEHDGQMYMIPETRQRRRIELWRADPFPHTWKFDRLLIDDIAAVDTTWLHYQNKFWLFVGVPGAGGSGSDELHVYWSDQPFGPWQPHAANPVVTTIRGARPAGSLFLHDGALVRPGQDGAQIYGHQVNFYRVDALSETEYRETPIGVLSPDWLPGNLGTHTYSIDDTFEVIDGRTRVLRGLRLRRRKLPLS